MRQLGTVIKFTFRSRFRSKAFLVTTIIFAIIISVAVNLPSIIQAFSSGKDKIGVIAANPQYSTMLADYYAKQENADIDIIILPDAGSKAANESAARAKVEAKEIKGYLEFADSGADFPKATYYSKESIASNTKGKLQAGVQAIKTELAVKDLGLSPEELNKLFEPAVIDSVQIADGANGKTEAQMTMAIVLVYALLFLLFMGVIAFGNMVATEITAEKSSRVMELLITSVAPLKQMFGKIIGICLLGLLQIVIFAVVVVINLNLPNNRSFLQSMHLSFSDIQVSLLVFFPIFYLLGYFLYSTLFAAIGSIVSRTEDLGQAVMPVTFLTLAGFYIALYGLSNPTAGFVVAMSFVPFFTPLIMFLRIGMSDPSYWQIGLSILILMLSILLMGWFSAKVYRTGVLMYGKRPSFKELRKAMKAFKV